MFIILIKEFRAEIKDPFGGYKELIKGGEDDKLEQIKEEDEKESE